MDSRPTVWAAGLIVATSLLASSMSAGPDAAGPTTGSSRTRASLEPDPTAPPEPTRDSRSGQATGTTSSTPPTAIPTLRPVVVPDGLELSLVPVLELEQPIAMTVRAAAAGRDPSLYVAGKTGRVTWVGYGSDGLRPDGAVLDIGDRLSSGGEQGLLGIAFSPDGEGLCLDYTDRSATTNVVEWSMQAQGVDSR